MTKRTCLTTPPPLRNKIMTMQNFVLNKKKVLFDLQSKFYLEILKKIAFVTIPAPILTVSASRLVGKSNCTLHLKNPKGGIIPSQSVYVVQDISPLSPELDLDSKYKTDEKFSSSSDRFSNKNSNCTFLPINDFFLSSTDRFPHCFL